MSLSWRKRYGTTTDLREEFIKKLRIELDTENLESSLALMVSYDKGRHQYYQNVYDLQLEVLGLACKQKNFGVALLFITWKFPWSSIFRTVVANRFYDLLTHMIHNLQFTNFACLDLEAAKALLHDHAVSLSMLDNDTFPHFDELAVYYRSYMQSYVQKNKNDFSIVPELLNIILQYI